MSKHIEKTLTETSQSITNTSIENAVVIQTGTLTLDENLLSTFALHQNDKRFLNQLVREKLTDVEGLVVAGKAKAASDIVDTIYAAHVKCLDEELESTLNYLKAIICLLDDDISRAKVLIGAIHANDAFKNNLDTLVNIEENGPNTLTVTEEMRSDQLFSYVLLQVLFKKTEWHFIFNNFEPSGSTPHIQDFFFALSTLNLFQFGEATSAFDIAIAKKPEGKYKLCRAIAYISHLMSQVAENIVDIELLRPVYYDLVEYENICAEFIEANPTPFYWTKLRSLLALDLDAFMIAHSELPQALKGDVNFKLLLAVYYQNQKCYGDAIALYEEILSTDLYEEAFYRIMICLFLQRNFAEIIRRYEAEDKSQVPHAITIYLIAIGELYPEKLDELFDQYFPDMYGEIDDMLLLIDVCQYSAKIKEVVHGKLEEHKEEICQAGKLDRIRSGFFAMQQNDIELGAFFFSGVENYTSADLEIVYSKLQHEKLEVNESVARWFVENNFVNAPILNILAHCYIKKERHRSAFSLLQRSFALERHIQTAVTIINLAAMIEEVNLADIQTYLDFISGEKEPIILLTVAQTLCKFGLYDQSERLVYEAIYSLGCHEDRHVIDNCLSVYLKMLGRVERTLEYDRVKADTVITLLEVGADSALTVCINQEEAFSNNTEAIGALHVSKDALYLKLINKALGSKIEYNGKDYEVKNIVNKYVHAFRYVLSKADDSGENPLIKKISVNLDEDVVQQMKEAMESYGPVEDLLEAYYSPPFGLPIECIRNNAYDYYVQIVQHLLFAEDNALHAGMNRLEFDSNHSYTVSLPALVVLGIQKQLDLLKALKDKIFIPSTLLAFIKERSESASRAIVSSPGSLVFPEDGGAVLIPTDTSMPDFWNSIYEVALMLSSVEVTADDRSELYRLIPAIDLEATFAKMNIHICQLDSFVAAQKSNSILLSDDLFFRRLAGWLGIENVNHSHLYDMMSVDDRRDALLELVKTNYLFVPPIIGYEPEYIQYISNSARKRAAYAELLNQYWSDIGHDS